MALIGLVAALTVFTVVQKLCVDLLRRVNPEKRGSVLDTRFRKDWLGSCDEAEKLMIGKCAYKAYAAANTACAVLAIIFAVCALIFNTGFLPSFAMCVIWFVLQFIYYRETIRYSKAGNRIS